MAKRKSKRKRDRVKETLKYKISLTSIFFILALSAFLVLFFSFIFSYLAFAMIFLADWLIRQEIEKRGRLRKKYFSDERTAHTGLIFMLFMSFLFLMVFFVLFIDLLAKLMTLETIFISMLISASILILISYLFTERKK